jgi:hypothetical protein
LSSSSSIPAPPPSARRSFLFLVAFPPSALSNRLEEGEEDMAAAFVKNEGLSNCFERERKIENFDIVFLSKNETMYI